MSTHPVVSSSLRRVLFLFYFLLIEYSAAFQIPRQQHAQQRFPTLCWMATTNSRTSGRRQTANLLEWAQAANIQIGAVDLKSRDASGFGWYAQANLSKNQVVLAVPSDVALTVETSTGPDDSKVSQLVSDRPVFRKLPWYVQFSAYFYKLSQKDSSKRSGSIDLKAWLQSLPKQFDTPLHWSSEDIQELQYDYMVNSVQRQEKAWKKHHQTLQSIGLADLSWDDFVWGCECARSRAFSGGYTGGAFNPLIYLFTLFLVTVYVGLNLGTLEQAANGAGVVVSATIFKDFVLPKLFRSQKYVICPLIDMANHDSTKYQGTVSFEYFANAYSLATEQEVLAGEQLMISYGPRSNDQLLQYYGFVEVDNPHDVYVMPPLREWDIGAIEKATGRSFAAGRLEKLDRAGLLGVENNDSIVDSEDSSEASNVSGGVVLTRTDGIDPAILQALRALVSNDEEWSQAGGAVGNFATEISPENERIAKLAAKTAIEIELESKPTTLIEDEELLKWMSAVKSIEAGTEKRLALQFRIEKKKLLVELIQELS